MPNLPTLCVVANGREHETSEARVLDVCNRLAGEPKPSPKSKLETNNGQTQANRFKTAPQLSLDLVTNNTGYQMILSRCRKRQSTHRHGSGAKLGTATQRAGLRPARNPIDELTSYDSVKPGAIMRSRKKKRRGTKFTCSEARLVTSSRKVKGGGAADRRRWDCGWRQSLGSLTSPEGLRHRVRQGLE